MLKNTDKQRNKNQEKDKRVDKLALANKELAFQTELDRSEMELVADDLMLQIDTANAPIIGIDHAGKINEWNQKTLKGDNISNLEFPLYIKDNKLDCLKIECEYKNG